MFEGEPVMVTPDGTRFGATPDLAAGSFYVPWVEYERMYGDEGPPASPPRRK
jgi:hypothetical protein